MPYLLLSFIALGASLQRWLRGKTICLPVQQTQETLVQSLGGEDPLEKEMVIYTCILASKISMDREAWWATGHGALKESETTEQAHTDRIKFVFLLLICLAYV